MVDKFTDLLKDANISDRDRAEILRMKNSYIDNLIKTLHHYAITEVHQGSYHGYKTRINSKQYISAPTMEMLMDKLYGYYSGATKKETATISSIFEEALEWHADENGCTEKTKRRNKELFLARISGSELAKMPIKDITARDVKKFLVTFKDKVTRRTLTNVKTIINYTLEYACEELEIVPFNVALGVKTNAIKVLPEKNVCDEAYTEFEIRRLVTHLISSTNVYDECIVFSVFVGLRPCELEALEWNDISGNTLILKRANTEHGNLKCGDHTRNHKHLCMDAILLLERYKKERPESTLIFPNKDGHCIDGDVINKHLKKACKALEMPYRSLYKTRAYVITQIASTGDYEASRKTAGHEQSYMQDHYINGNLTDNNRASIEKALNLGIFSDFLNEKTS